MRGRRKVLEVGPVAPSPWWPDGRQCAYGCLNRATHVVIEGGYWYACAEHAQPDGAA